MRRPDMLRYKKVTNSLLTQYRIYDIFILSFKKVFLATYFLYLKSI